MNRVIMNGTRRLAMLLPAFLIQVARLQEAGHLSGRFCFLL